jgi:hypothetical protein
VPTRTASLPLKFCHLKIPQSMYAGSISIPSALRPVISQAIRRPLWKISMVASVKRASTVSRNSPNGTRKLPYSAQGMNFGGQ